MAMQPYRGIQGFGRAIRWRGVLRAFAGTQSGWSNRLGRMPVAHKKQRV